MKELSIEEKAKRYDEAIKVAKSNYETIMQIDNDCTFAKEGIVNTFHHIFPELAESEDERISREITEFLVDFNNGEYERPNENTIDSWLSWLEKQSKSIYNVPSREVILAIWELGNGWKELTNGSISTEHGTQLDYIQKHWHESEYYLKEKQGEQPKKHNVCDNCDQQGCCVSPCPMKLVEKHGEQKSLDDIVKEITKNKETAMSFLKSCGIMNANGELADEYKIEQNEKKPIDKVKPKFKVGDVIRSLEEAKEGITDGLPVVVSIDEEYYHCNNELISIKYQDKYEYPPMNRKQKPAEWTAEDENQRINTIGLVKNANDCAGILDKETALNWLNDIKDRFVPQSKQEWSEEDENRFRNLIYLVEHSDEGKATKEGFIKFINRLKSLRPQSQWKPSDEQMDMLKIAVSTSNSIVLDSLYNDLMKLKG